MKNYTITVNGNVYDVTVEEKGSTGAAPVAASAPAPKAAPKAATGAGSIKIEAGAAGKVFKLEATPGTQVKAGDTVLVLEVMKMETPVVAPKDGLVQRKEKMMTKPVESLGGTIHELRYRNVK